MRMVRVLTIEGVESFAKMIAALNPRARRGFLDSMYANIVHGKLACEEGAIERFEELLARYGFVPHAMKLSVPRLPDVKGMEIDAIGEFHAGYGAGHQTLSIGSKMVNSGPGWSVTEPVCAVVVRLSRRYKLGQVLRRMPANAVPVHVFFAGAQLAAA